ncbi:ets DNA-binding protein pokkuri isoform X2 [Cimex lectularius]|uniref:Ets DNA-binding protein pokkuri n=1 Tax=Cimex lectularius TaxID=79782 RepID=A0A8I6RCY9_CIMLE|nr:ets DNA-binding protein pokkuri isoform X2 [Cimex lectularius]
MITDSKSRSNGSRSKQEAMKLVLLSGNRGGSNMERVPIFNHPELFWRYPLGFQPSTHSYPQFDFKTQLPTSLASDPRLWSREDVVAFLRWCEYEFDLPRFDMDFFQMNGKALCLLTKSDLNERSPGCGDVLHNVLHLLMRERLPSSPITPHFPLTPTWAMPPAIEFPASQNSVTLSPAPSLDSQGSPRQPDQNPNLNLASYPSVINYQSGHSGSSGSAPSDSEGEEPNSPNAQAAVSSPQPQSPLNVKPQIFFPSDNISEPNTNGRLLWDFLQQLLNDSLQRYTSYIAWKNREAGVFKIVDPPGLAKLWGIQKNHLSMNYDKMSRALRYYYRVNILRKVQGERHCYQFLRNPSELKSIKHISLLRNQMNNQQPHQPVPVHQLQAPQTQLLPPPQQQQQPQQPPPPPPQPPQTQPQSQQQQQPATGQPNNVHFKSEFEDEPTDLSTHAHSNGNMSAELQLSLLRDNYHLAQAEDLSLSHTQTVKTEAS